MENLLVRIFGFIPTVFHGDAAVFDRWWWLKRHFGAGGGRTLDAGCGSGAFTMYAAKKGSAAIGISFDERNNHTAEERARLLNIKNVEFISANLGELERLAGRLGLFDRIICFETIEHILDDRKLIRDFSRLLKPNGRLMITAPYTHNKPMPGDELLSVTEDGGHVRVGYTHSDMRKILDEFGFTVQREDYLSGYLSQLLISCHRKLAAIMPMKLAWLIILPFRVIRIFDVPFTNLIHYPYMSIGVVAEKRK